MLGACRTSFDFAARFFIAVFGSTSEDLFGDFFGDAFGVVFGDIFGDDLGEDLDTSSFVGFVFIGVFICRTTV